jgi:D-lactate dehydrogenase
VGLIGLGHVGKAAIPIFKGLGCKILGYDIVPQQNLHDINEVDLNTLYKASDIISLHIPLTEQTKYLINQASIEKMKKGVMILNTARGGLIKTVDALEALKSGQIGYLGIDVYENEKGLFFEDHETDQVTDPLLSELMKMPNVLVTPHQAFLTNEALEEIALETIKTLDDWDM